MRVALFAIVALVALTSVAAYDCTIGTHPAFGVTPADQSECTCSIAAGDYSPLASTQPNVLTVNLGASHATSTRFESQKLYIVHDEHVKWFDGVQSDNNQPNPAYCRNYFNWTTIASPVSSCHRRWVGVARWADVYQAGTNDCKLTRTTDANNIVKFTFDFSWSHKQTVKAASGSGREVLPYERTVVQKMPFDIILPTEFTITSDAQQIFAPVLLLAAITKQEVVGSVPGNVTANLQIYTSLQHPFQLVNPVATIPASIASSSAIAIDNTACATVSGVCEQRFNYALTPGANTCTFNGIYRLDFGIICRTPADECPLDAATNTAGFQFQLASSSHCAVIADTIELAGEVAVLDAALNPKVNFLDTQVVIFQLSITSAKASIQSSTIREAVLNRPWNTAAPTQALVTNFVIDSTAASTYSVQTQVGGTSAAGSAPASGSHPTLQLTVKSVPLGLAQDEIKTITVSFVVFVQYQNAGQASSTTNSFEEEAEYGSSVVSVTASAGFGGSAASTSSSTSSPKIAGVNAFAAAGAFVAIVAAVAAVVVTGARVRANRIVQRYSVVEETATSHA